jgi:hypothetical protein
MSCKRLVWFYILIGLFLAIGLTYADPLPVPDTSSMPQVWDNLNGTAGEPVSLYDIYLVAPQKIRTTILFDPITTSYGLDSTGKTYHFVYYKYLGRHPQLEFKYFRINMPISIAYGISRSLEIEFRRAYLYRSKTIGYLPESLLVKQPFRELRGNTNGLGDFSVRLRTKILGEPDKPLYMALGIGMKFASSAEFDTTYYLPISPGSTDLFFGIYNAIRFGRLIIPSAVTYSHTGRYLNGLPIGEIITYRIGLIAEIHRFADLNFSLKGYEITDESKPIISPANLNLVSGITDKIIEISPQGISKTTAEIGLSIKIPKIRAAISGGIITDLRGKRTYYDDISSIFSMQIGF